jgi:hypothetical protein
MHDAVLTMATSEIEVLSERVILRDAFLEVLHSHCYNIFKSTSGTDRLHYPSISFRPRRPVVQWLSEDSAVRYFDLSNPATFLISFTPDVLMVEMHRATGVRLIASLSYEDPCLFDRLTRVLNSVDIYLNA